MKPPGSLVGLYYDGAALVEEGDVIETQSGRRYLIHAVRVQERGKHAGRQHLRALVMHPDDPLPEGATVHPLHWYRRVSKRR